MSTMTKTTIITWTSDQINTPEEEASSFLERCIQELYQLQSAGKTSGQSTVDTLSDGARVIKMEWIDQESAQAWLDFVLSTVKSLYGPDKSFQSGVIEDIS